MASFDFLSIDFPAPTDAVYALQPFDTLLLSFCADTPAGSSIEVQARVRLTTGEWTAWFSWGVWSPLIDRHSVNSRDEYAALDTDTLCLEGGRMADAAQVRAVCTPDPASSAMPVLRRVTLSCKNSGAPAQERPDAVPDVRAPAPCTSQMVRHPAIGNVICSATTIAMLLNQKGENLLPEEVALHNYDSAYRGCGNWCFSAAIAGSYGYNACVRHATVEQVAQEIARGNAVGVSVRYTNDPANGKYPYLEGAPCTTPGHLMVLCGFHTAPDGARYAVVHDPAAPDNATVERFYPLNAFLKAWAGRVCYFVGEREDSARWTPVRVPAQLQPAQEPDVYRLIHDGERVTLTAAEGFPAVVPAYVTRRAGERDADCDFAYGTVTPEGDVRLPGYAGQRAFIITNRGMVYVVD